MNSASVLSVARHHKYAVIAIAGAVLVVSALAPFPVFPSSQSEPARAAAPRSVDFATDILPIFQAACVKCHGGETAQAKLRLDSEAAVLQGGISGKVIVPGNSKDSLLVKRLLGSTDAP